MSVTTQLIESPAMRAVIRERDEALAELEAAKFDNDWAWAAGLFEGEGCATYTTRPKTGRMSPSLTVTSTDFDVLERFQSIIGVGSITTKRHDNPKWKDCYHWKITGQTAINLMKFEPFVKYLASRRTARMAEIVAKYEAQPHPYGIRKSVTHCPQGHEYTEENTYVARNWAGGPSRTCRTCHRERESARQKLMRANGWKRER